MTSRVYLSTHLMFLARPTHPQHSLHPLSFLVALVVFVLVVSSRCVSVPITMRLVLLGVPVPSVLLFPLSLSSRFPHCKLWVSVSLIRLLTVLKRDIYALSLASLFLVC